jgi:hypothetical protein
VSLRRYNPRMAIGFMDPSNIMDAVLSLGVLGLAIVAVFFGIVVGVPTFLYHRREVLRIRGTNAKEIGKLRDRIDALDQRCEKLEEQVASAHILLADEQRQLDRKLSNLVGDSMIPPEKSEEQPRKSRDERIKN